MNRDIEERSRAYIQEHPVESKASALKVQQRIAHSELNAGHTNITHTLHIPKYFSQRDRKKFQDIVSTMMRFLQNHRCLPAGSGSPGTFSL